MFYLLARQKVCSFLLLMLFSCFQLFSQPSFRTTPVNGTYNGSPAALVTYGNGLLYRIKSYDANGKGANLTVNPKPSFMTYNAAGLVNSIQVSTAGPSTNSNQYGAMVRENSTKRIFSVSKVNTDRNIYVTDSLGNETVFAQKLYHSSSSPVGGTHEGGMLIIGNYLYLGYVGGATLWGGIIRYNLSVSNPTGEVVTGGLGTAYKVSNMAHANGVIYIASGTTDVLYKVVLDNTNIANSVWSSIAMPGIGAARGLAFNQTGDLYIAGGTTTSCQIYTVPAASLSNPVATAVGSPLSATVMLNLEFDTRNNLYVGGVGKFYRLAAPAYTSNTSYTLGQNIGLDMLVDDSDVFYFLPNAATSPLRKIDLSPILYTYGTSAYGVFPTTITATDDLNQTTVQSFNIVVLPDAPNGGTSSRNYTQCLSSGATRSISDLSSWFGNTNPVLWYTTSTGGTSLPTSTILSTGTYYASQVISGAESVNRTAISVILETTPTLTISPASVAVTQGQSVTFTASGGGAYASSLSWSAITGPFVWFSPMSGPTVTAVPNTSAIYQVQTTNGCPASATVNVTVLMPAHYYTSIISAANSVIPADGQSTTLLTIELRDMNNIPLTTGGDQVIAWTNAGSISNVTDLGNGTYTALLTSSQTNGVATINFSINGNQANSSTTVTMNTPPPTGAPIQQFCTNNVLTLADLTVNGTQILWYDNTVAGNILSSSTPLVNGTTYYASQTTAQGESPTRLAVTVTISPTISVAVSPSSAHLHSASRFP
jgi:hypothetical protein